MLSTESKEYEFGSRSCKHPKLAYDKDNGVFVFVIFPSLCRTCLRTWLFFLVSASNGLQIQSSGHWKWLDAKDPSVKIMSPVVEPNWRIRWMYEDLNIYETLDPYDRKHLVIRLSVLSDLCGNFYWLTMLHKEKSDFRQSYGLMAPAPNIPAWRDTPDRVWEAFQHSRSRRAVIIKPSLTLTLECMCTWYCGQ